MSTTDQLLAINQKAQTANADANTALLDTTFSDSTSSDVTGIGGSIDIGKTWIDGKQIYRTVINASNTVSTLTGDSTDVGARIAILDVTTIWPDSSNVLDIVDYRVTINDHNANLFTDASYLNKTISPIGADFGFTSIFNGTSIMFIVGSEGPNLSTEGLKAYVIIEYTKQV